MIHRKIEETGGKPFIRLEEADLATLGVTVGELVSLDAVEAAPVERGKAFVERYIKTFEALAK
ncbi:MAG: hypothetical protein Q8R45_02665 [Brevundimonas sp.]|uniref:hypothetical protein n=1 Tax=Brevundimonas sp. TaxID=1871086 RepID=UPI0027237DA7|nr:hypothetical protein [Brevundimonas sp.]MDO9588224.1 hypothetical protein [Brevundimonas sp.]MDP2764434.1 hypothetical protein [Brevundimonas sp.]MDP3655855.1 hypothetical protein [Brevundimonas sp.]MDZ4112753.1 hypothetical protein [Brevundimonas sp.]